MPMPALLSRPALATLLSAVAASAQAEEGALGHDLAGLSRADVAPGYPAPVGPAPVAYLQDSQLDEDILLPAASPEGDDGRKWARDYIAIAGGVITAPSYNGSNDRVILPGFYVRGRVSGYSFSTRGTNFQVDLLRQKRGQKTDFKFGPIVNLRGDRNGRINDVQVEALGKKKIAVELGLLAGVTQSGVFTSKYDQLGFRVVALQDVSGKHGSWVASPTIDYGSPLSKRAYLGVSASVNIYGKGFGAYYYDVDPLGSAASGLPVYSRAGDKVTAGKYTLGVAGAFGLSGDLRKGFVLIGGAQYGRMTSRFGDSPIVSIAGSRDQWLGGVGLAYQF